jgi:hypothetical protein
MVMRTPNIGSILYSPNDAPADPAQVQRFLREELAKISAAISALAAGHIDESFTAPAKPRTGDIRFADGTTWDPGSGRGIYWYDAVASTWNILG